MSWVRRVSVAGGLLAASLCFGRGVAQDAPFIQPQPLANSAIYESGSETSLLASQEPLPAEEVKPVPAESGAVYDPTLSGQLCNDIWACCHACCQAGLYAGAEGTFLAPVNEPEQRVVLTDLLTNQQFSAVSEPGLGAGIRTWLGLHCEGWGFRVTYWHFENDTIVADPTIPTIPGANFLSFYHLNMDVLDVEVTQRMCLGGWLLYSSFGGRFAELERQSGVVGYGELGNGVQLTGLAIGANQFSGCGFTFSLNGVKPICCWRGWSTVWNFRGSFLWGDGSEVFALTQAQAVTGPPLPIAAAYARDVAVATADNDCVFITELGVGLQYTHCCSSIPAMCFFRVMAEYQHWETGNTRAQTGDFALLAGGPPAFGAGAAAFADAHDGDLDLIGFTIGAGLTY